jgi:hypothetical protein
MHDREEREEQDRLAHRELRIENVRRCRGTSHASYVCCVSSLVVQANTPGFILACDS